MAVEITTQIIHASYAAVINEIQPNANIFDNPNQQGTVYPAWFIVHRSPVEVQKDMSRRYNGNRYNITYQIDLWYMIEQNIPRLYDQYTHVAEALDAKLEYMPIFGSDAVVHVHDRTWALEMNALKYSTTLRLRVYVDSNFVFEPIDVIEDLQAYLKDSGKAEPVETVSLYFRDTLQESGAEMPDAITANRGETVTLPTVYESFEMNGITYTPSKWTAGNFGDLYKMENNYTASLLWSARSDAIPLYGSFRRNFIGAAVPYGFVEGAL